MPGPQLAHDYDASVSRAPISEAALADFDIVKELGRGGMGVVYLARQIATGRLVALKVLSSALATDPRYRARFRREMAIISQVHHPNIVPVHDVIERGETLALVMQYLEGETLDVLIRRRAELTPARRILQAESSGRNTESFSLSPPQVLSEYCTDEAWRSAGVSIFARLARALRHIHMCGLMHRDIKPSNILIDKGGQPWLLDFGLARPLEVATNSTTQTLLGTAHYLAPELLDPNREGLDIRTDLYALGVAIYEFLALRRPFADRRADSLFRAIACEDPVPLRHICADIPRPLERVVMNALRKRPEDRYADLGQFAEDLNRVATNQPVRAKPDSQFRKLRRVLNANRIAAGALAFAALTWLGLIVHTMHQGRVEDLRRETALRAADTAYEAGDFDEAISQFQVYVALGGDADIVAPRMTESRRHLWRSRGMTGLR